jgi:hypothetical protein
MSEKLLCIFHVQPTVWCRRYRRPPSDRRGNTTQVSGHHGGMTRTTNGSLLTPCSRNDHPNPRQHHHNTDSSRELNLPPVACRSKRRREVKVVMEQRSKICVSFGGISHAQCGASDRRRRNLP